MKLVLIKNTLLIFGIILVAMVVFLLIPDRTIAGMKDCDVGKCPREVTIADNGKVLTYRVNRRFSVVLDRFLYPPAALHCENDEIIQKTISLKDLYPNQMHRFIVNEAGTCLLGNGDFSVTIIAVAEK